MKKYKKKKESFHLSPWYSKTNEQREVSLTRIQTLVRFKK